MIAARRQPTKRELLRSARRVGAAVPQRRVKISDTYSQSVYCPAPGARAGCVLRGVVHAAMGGT